MNMEDCNRRGMKHIALRRFAGIYSSTLLLLRVLSRPLSELSPEDELTTRSSDCTTSVASPATAPPTTSITGEPSCSITHITMQDQSSRTQQRRSQNRCTGCWKARMRVKPHSYRTLLYIYMVKSDPMNLTASYARTAKVEKADWTIFHKRPRLCCSATSATNNLNRRKPRVQAFEGEGYTFHRKRYGGTPIHQSPTIVTKS
jgi:hypothetical protein